MLRPAKEICPAFDNDVLSDPLFGGAQRHGASQRIGRHTCLRRFDDFLAAHKIVGVGCQVGESGRSQSRRHHVQRNGEALLRPGRFRDISSYHRHGGISLGISLHDQLFGVRLVFRDRNGEILVKYEHFRACRGRSRIASA